MYTIIPKKQSIQNDSIKVQRVIPQCNVLNFSKKLHLTNINQRYLSPLAQIPLIDVYNN